MWQTAASRRSTSSLCGYMPRELKSRAPRCRESTRQPCYCMRRPRHPYAGSVASESSVGARSTLMILMWLPSGFRRAVGAAPAGAAGLVGEPLASETDAGSADAPGHIVSPVRRNRLGGIDARPALRVGDCALTAVLGLTVHGVRSTSSVAANRSERGGAVHGTAQVKERQG